MASMNVKHNTTCISDNDKILFTIDLHKTVKK